MATQQAISTESLVDSLGINTHIDFGAYGYQNLTAVENAIKYLGLVNVRDSPGTTADLTSWQQVAQATGAKFDAYIGETSPAGMSTELSTMQQLAAAGLLNFIEGGNEEDDPFPQSLGNTLAYTAQFQQQVYQVAHQYGLSAINMSFGQGWTAANDWHGDYDKVGNLSAYADYANAHTYPSGAPDSTLQMLNSDAKLAASSRPVITTEIGWNSVDPTAKAKYVLDTAMDGIKDGDVKTYFYSLFDDGSGAYGLMNAGGSPQPAGTALHNLTSLLSDAGGSFTPGSLTYSLSGTQGGDNSFLMEKSDGSYWLSLWNESAKAHTVTLSLGSSASQVLVFDPLTGTGAVQTFSNTSMAQITVPDHPVLVEIIGSGGSGGGGTGGGGTGGDGTGGGGTGGGGTGGGGTGDGGKGGGGTGGGGTGDGGKGGGGTGGGTPTDLALTAPQTVTVSSGGSLALSGVSVSDAWAAGHAGSMALNITDVSGTLSLNGTSYGNAIHIEGSFAQVTADLAGLSYKAGTSGSDTITVDVWNQAGVEVTKQIAVSMGGGSGGDGSGGSGGGGSGGSGGGGNGGSGGSSGGGGSGGGIVIPTTTANYIASVSNQTITATSGDHMIFIGGTGDTLTATGGAESVMAFLGGNRITTGSGNDTIRFGGSNNVIDAGGGNNVLQDSGSDGTIVLPIAGQGNDNIYGFVLQNGDTLDLRPELAATSWNGNDATLGNFVQLNTVNNSAVISIDPSGATGGASYTVATLQSSGAVGLSTLLAHAVTH